MNFATFWDVMPFSLVDHYQSFKQSTASIFWTAGSYKTLVKICYIIQYHVSEGNLYCHCHRNLKCHQKIVYDF